MRFFRILTLMLLLLFLPSLAAAEGLSIIAANFPAYDFARVLAGDGADVRLLLPPGSESHSYEPSPRDLIAIQECDLFLYTGGESDHWIVGLLDSLEERRPAVFRMMDCVTLLQEEEPDSAEHGRAEPEEETEWDEHVWTSPKNAMKIVRSLADVLISLSEENAPAIRSSLDRYLQELEALDADFEAAVQNGKRDLLLFGDRFPFRYLTSAYGLRYDAAFPGCSEDSEPSVRTVISLVDTIRAEGIPVVFYIEFSSRRTADILCEETGARPLLLHSCHNVSAVEMEAGASYLSLMRQNVEALKEALD